MNPADEALTAVPFVGELEGKQGCFICAGHNGHGEFNLRLCKSPVAAHTRRRDGEDHDMCTRRCNATQRWNVGGHGTARVFQTDIRKDCEE